MSDGYTVDLGLVRDSELNKTETFQGFAHLGLPEVRPHQTGGRSNRMSLETSTVVHAFLSELWPTGDISIYAGAMGWPDGGIIRATGDGAYQLFDGAYYADDIDVTYDGRLRVYRCDTDGGCLDSYPDDAPHVDAPPLDIAKWIDRTLRADMSGRSQ